MRNNPVNFTDPTGHFACGDGETKECGTGKKQDPNEEPYKPPKSKKDKDAISGGTITDDLQGDSVAFSVDTFDPSKIILDPNLIFSPFAKEDWIINCRTANAECIIYRPPFRGHWDWSRIDWKTTGIDTVSTFASAANLKWASDGLRNFGRLSNFTSTGNTFVNEMKRRDGDIASSILNKNTILSLASYVPVYGVYASGMSVVNDISDGYWEEELPVYGPFLPNEVR